MNYNYQLNPQLKTKRKNNILCWMNNSKKNFGIKLLNKPLGKKESQIKV